MAATSLTYAPQGETLRQFHNADDFVRCVIGPLGSSKTTAAIVECLRRADIQKPDKNHVRRSRGAVVRNTYSDLLASTVRDWKEVVPPHVGDFKMSPSPEHNIRYRRKDGTQVECDVLFMGFDREQDVRKIRGLQLTWAWMDEARELAKPVVDMVLGRLGRFPQRAVLGDYWTGAILTTNAPAADDWLGKMYLETKPKTWRFFIQPGAVLKHQGRWIVNTGAENLANLGVQYYQRQLYGKSEDWIRSNLANEFVFVIDGRPVHPDFSQSLHVIDPPYEPLADLPINVGIDFGRTPAAVFGQRLLNGRWIIFDELVTTNMGARTFGEILRKHINDNYEAHDFEFTGDPAGQAGTQVDDMTPFGALLESGIDAWPAQTNDFEIRSGTLDVLLRKNIEGEPAIQVTSNCRTLVRGLAGAYQFRRVQVAGTERFHDKPEKGPESHSVESLHYLLMGAGEGETSYFTSWSGEYEDVVWHPDQSQFG